MGLQRPRRGLPALASYEEALSDFSKAIALRPNDADAFYNNRFNLYIAMAGSARRGRLRPCHRAQTERPQAPQQSRLALVSLRRYEEALRDYDQALALNPNLYETYFNRALVFDATAGTNSPSVSTPNPSR